MNKLILFAVAFLVAGQASAHEPGDHAGRHHRHLMSSHAQLRDHGGGYYYRVPDFNRAPLYAPPAFVPSDDDDAEGRTSG